MGLDRNGGAATATVRQPGSCIEAVQHVGCMCLVNTTSSMLFRLKQEGESRWTEGLV